MKPILRKLKILVLTPRYPPSHYSPARHIHEVNKRLQAWGFDITVITDREQAEPDGIDGLTVYRIPRIGLGFLYGTLLGNLIWCLASICYIFKNKNDFDLLHSVDCHLWAGLFTITSRIINKPIVLLNNGVNGAISNKRLHHRARLYFIRKWARVIAVSNHTYDELAEHRFQREAAFTIFNGVDTESFRPCPEYNRKIEIRKRLGLPRHSFVVTYAGWLKPEKGVDILVCSWKKIKQNLPSAYLLLLGDSSNSSFRDWLETYVHRNGLQDNIDIRGHVENVNEYLQATDCFVFPSQSEGLPIALLEAMSTALPCIARMIGGVIDVIAHERNGILCEGANREVGRPLIDAIVRIADDRGLAENLGRAARRSVLERFSIDKVAETYGRVFQKIHRQYGQYVK